MTFVAKPGGVLMPVPTAVPPSGSWARWGSALRTRATALSIWVAYPPNSWPSVTGVASIRCVRPALTTSSNSIDFSRSAVARCRREGIRW